MCVVSSMAKLAMPCMSCGVPVPRIALYMFLKVPRPGAPCRTSDSMMKLAMLAKATRPKVNRACAGSADTTNCTALTRAPTSKNGHTRKQSRHPFLIPPRRDFMTQTHAIIKFLQTQARTLVSALKMLYRNARCSWVAVCVLRTPKSETAASWRFRIATAIKHTDLIETYMEWYITATGYRYSTIIYQCLSFKLPPGVFYACFCNHAHRLRLEKLL